MYSSETTFTVTTNTFMIEWNVQEFSEIIEQSKEIPLSIFSNKEPTLQTAVRYLKENLNYTFKEIAQELGRTESTIRTTYAKANKKTELLVESAGTIPLNIFSQTPLSPLEALVNHLNVQGRKNVEIATILSLSPKTTWTIKQRIKKKGVTFE